MEMEIGGLERAEMINGGRARAEIDRSVGGRPGAHLKEGARESCGKRASSFGAAAALELLYTSRLPLCLCQERESGADSGRKRERERREFYGRLLLRPIRPSACLFVRLPACLPACLFVCCSVGLAGEIFIPPAQ